jgi:hypothetical protein
MPLILHLPSALETQLSAEAAQLGIPLSEYALRLISEGRNSPRTLKNGGELVNYWQAEGVVGSRSNIADVEAHSRALRKQAETRPRS